VLAEYGTACMVRMAGCTRVATTKDHIVPYSHGGDDSLANFRPSCRNCNSKRGNRVVSGYGATVKVVIGPPAAGKTTYVTDHATAHDVVIDLDALARALMPIQLETTHVYPVHVRHVAIGARKAAIDRATRLRERVTVWIIQALPTPDDLTNYRSLGWQVITCDPGRDVVLERCRRLRPDYIMPAVDRWYASLSNAPVTNAGAQLAEYDEAVAALKPATAGAAAPSRDW
jgi:hypothetical protein